MGGHPGFDASRRGPSPRPVRRGVRGRAPLRHGRRSLVPRPAGPGAREDRADPLDRSRDQRTGRRGGALATAVRRAPRGLGLDRGRRQRVGRFHRPRRHGGPGRAGARLDRAPRPPRGEGLRPGGRGRRVVLRSRVRLARRGRASVDGPISTSRSSSCSWRCCSSWSLRSPLRTVRRAGVVPSAPAWCSVSRSGPGSGAPSRWCCSPRSGAAGTSWLAETTRSAPRLTPRSSGRARRPASSSSSP